MAKTSLLTIEQVCSVLVVDPTEEDVPVFHVFLVPGQVQYSLSQSKSNSGSLPSLCVSYTPHSGRPSSSTHSQSDQYLQYRDQLKLENCDQCLGLLGLGL